MGLEDYLAKRVMVVDDLPSIRTDLINILNSLGFTNIKEMPDGKAALDELVLKASEGKPYEIIFSDINMPIIKIRTNCPNININIAYLISRITDKSKETKIKFELQIQS